MVATVGAAVPVWYQMYEQRYDADRLLRDLGVVRPPVDVFAVAQWLGANLQFHTGAKWDGAVDSTDPHNVTIYVNAEQSLNRQRFTVAHEIGHLIIHGPGRAFRDDFSSTGRNYAEVQANRFAADLLMPSWLINAVASSFSSVGTLADAFEVSVEAMTYRLKNLGYRVG